MTKKPSPKSKKIRKFRIVLDSAFAKAEFFLKLSKKAKLYHSVYDFKLSPQAEDKDIYQKAFENNCLVLTINFRDFRKLIKSNSPGILGIESQLTTAKIDERVAEYISDKNPADFKGKAIKI